MKPLFYRKRGKRNLFVTKRIAGKDVYIFEKHNHAIIPWALYRRRIDNPPILLSLDHHTDKHRAFNQYLCIKLDSLTTGNWDEDGKHFAATVSEMDYKNDSSMRLTAERLREDEHVDAAIRANIIRATFMINYDEHNDIPISHELDKYYSEITKVNMGLIKDEPTKPVRPFTYPESENGIYVIEHGCHSKCNKSCHDDECQIPHFNDAIETAYLLNKFQIINEINDSVNIFTDFFQENYVLDFDLDYFHTKKSIDPHDHCLIYRLIRHAGIISIAKEPGYITGPQYETGINSEFLLASLLEHIKKALGGK